MSSEVRLECGWQCLSCSLLATSVAGRPTLSLLCHSLQRQNFFLSLSLSQSLTMSILCSVLIMKINIKTYLDAFTKALWE